MDDALPIAEAGGPAARAYRRIVRWAFDRLYHELAPAYDLIAALVSGGRWRAWARTALPLAAGRVLELGCGTGHVQRALADQGVPAVGLDRSPPMLRQARRRAPGARLVRADARTLPFPDATFDTIIATFPSEYIAAPATAAEIRRALRPGGRVAVALWAEIDDRSLYLRALDLLYRLTLQRSPRPAQAAEPAPPRTELHAAIEAAGLRTTGFVAPAPGGRVIYLLGERTAD